MAYCKDLREHVKALEARGKLIRIKREINKDTELMPLVRCQFRGLPAEDRKTFLFENVTDAKGRTYGIPVLVASHAANREVYAIGMNCQPDEIMERWARARRSPIEPRLVASGPVHEEVHLGERLLDHGGLEEFPVPISTPGFDNAPYYTAANWISKDPETGIRNVGNYRGMIKSPTRVGVMNPPSKDLRTHWEKCRLAGKPLQAAIVIGTGACSGILCGSEISSMMSMNLRSAAESPARRSNWSSAGPSTWRCLRPRKSSSRGTCRRTSWNGRDLSGNSPATWPRRWWAPTFNVTCITHRKNPVFNVFLSQFPPSESSTLRNIGEEANLYKFLRVDCGLPVVDVAVPEQTSAQPFCVISMKKTHPSQAWQVLNGAVDRFLRAQDRDRRGRRYRPPQCRLGQLGARLASSTGTATYAS